MALDHLLVIGVFAPLAAFVLLAFFGHKLGKPAASWPAIIGIGISLACALIVTLLWLGMDGAARAHAAAAALRLHWVKLGDIDVYAAVKLDSLTVAVYLMVTVVSTCIFVFSRGYMSGHSDEVDHANHYHRFFTYLSLFAFSMLGLVVSASLLFLFIFWELVGVCSYFLIGFYFDKKYASNAAMKAFITNRVGDFGFIIGLAMVLTFLGDLSIDGAAAAFAQQAASGTGIFAASFDVFGRHLSGTAVATFMGVCLFCGCLGKSAQVPLQVWLPDAMAGPTPVSALIHAATMVAAGVYLVARIFPLLTPGAQMVVAVIGCITLTMAALIAIVQTDIKKALAYSTLSQLGYMVFGLGMGAWIAALFHLITHAFFKAMLFLGSGQVIEGCHHVQDIRQMGGLRRKMPVTCWTFFIGVLAISGFGIPGLNASKFTGVGGYYSKDEILAVAYYRAYGQEPAATHHAGASTEPISSPWQKSFEPESGSFPQALCWRNSTNLPDSPAFARLRSGEESLTSGREALLPRAARLAGYQPHEPAGGHAPSGRGHGAGEQGTGAGHSAGGSAGDQHASTNFADRLGGPRLPVVPKWLFWLPVIIAYVTPFYMMRVWWLTFMGTPRDKHVHEHAHEIALMKWPLVILAAGTFVSSWFLFRPLIADAAVQVGAAPLIAPLDGHEDLVHHAAHAPLTRYVGCSFLAGWVLAWLIYRNGLAVAAALLKLPGVAAAHHVLTHKFYFDEVYDYLLVGGTRLLAYFNARFDQWVLDAIVNNLARGVRRMAMFSGNILDARGVDRMAEGLGQGAFGFGDLFRAVQTGRIRNYVIFVAIAALVVAVIIVQVTKASS